MEYLCSLDNLETHADLIAGLPVYSLDMLCADIAKLVAIGVDELQVESLKVLPGTHMRRVASEKGLRYSPLPPYEILQTPAMPPKDLRTAMHISRMLDFYYNAKPWQNITRSLICENLEFITQFTAHLNKIMVLDSPLGLERRGVILYEYCREHHPDRLTDISIAWIEAGCSLKKEPAGNISKIKNLDGFLKENGYRLSIRYGEAAPSHRYFLLKSTDGCLLFGYDSELHQPAPVFMAGLS